MLRFRVSPPDHGQVTSPVTRQPSAVFSSTESTTAFFHRVTSRPRLAVALGVVVIALCGAGLSKLVKDTSVKAFIPPGHASLQADEMAESLFGISDTLAVAIVLPDGGSVFGPATLSLIDELTSEIAALPNVRYERVASIATESSIRGDDGALLIEPYVESATMDVASANNSRARWRNMAPHRGSLVSEDETAAIVMAELVDSGEGAETYETVLDIVGRYEAPGIEFHVAGPAAVSGYLGRYIDQDARKLQPLVFVLVLGFIYLAFRRFAALPGPLFVVIGSAAGSLGIMSWLGIPYFAITNALPVIVVAISVADAIHVLSAYYQRREERPDATVRFARRCRNGCDGEADYAHHDNHNRRIRRHLADVDHAADYLLWRVRCAGCAARLGVFDFRNAKRDAADQSRPKPCVRLLARTPAE